MLRRLGRLLGIVALTVGLHGLVYLSGVVPFVDFRLLDIASATLHSEPNKPFPSTLIVEIDEKSLAQMGQWPWPRIITAKVIQEILKGQPSALGIDILFPEADRTSPIHLKSFYNTRFNLDVTIEGLPSFLQDHDILLGSVLEKGRSVLPIFASKDGGNTSCSFTTPLKGSASLPLHETKHLLCNIPILQTSAKGIGFINAAVDGDGVFRRQLLALKHHNEILPSLAIAMLQQIDPTTTWERTSSLTRALKFSFLDKTITTDENAGVLNYLYSKKSFQRISASDVASGNVDPSLFTGKLVLLGATATGLYDQFVTPNGEIVPGLFVHASLLENMLHENLLYQPEISKKISFAFSFLIGLILVWLVTKKHYLYSWGVFLVSCFASIGLMGLFLQKSLYASLGYFLVPFLFLFFMISLFFAVLHYVERKQFLEDLGEAHSATIDSMTMVAESRDVETGAHIVRTKEYVKILAEFLHRNGFYKNKLTPHIIDLMYRAAPLHDIGKVGIPDAILQKQGRLDEEEMHIMRKHASIGGTIIENAINSYNKTNEFLTIAANIAHTHHEKWNGSGYPQGLKGEEIPLEGRLMALADVYDALISRRCYKEAMDFEEAEAIIMGGDGVHFDPTIIKAFFVLKEQFKEIALRHKEYL